MFDPEILLQQLSDLGRQLNAAVDELGQLDMLATGDGCEYNKLREEYEDVFAREFLNSSGGVEARKMEARLKATPARLIAQDANAEWERSKSRVRTQQAMLKVLHTRVEIGRSMLSTEKTRMTIELWIN